MGDTLREILPLRGKAWDLPWAPPPLKIWAKGEDLSCELEDKPGNQGRSEKSSVLLKQRKQNVLRRWSSL